MRRDGWGVWMGRVMVTERENRREEGVACAVLVVGKQAM